MKSTVGLAVLLTVVAVSAEPWNPKIKAWLNKLGGKPEKKISVDGHPDFCRDSDCPAFNRTATTDEFETRIYATANWVRYTTEGSYWWYISMTSFKPLYRYITGNNELKEKFAMTRPVLVKLGQMKTMPIQTAFHFFMPSSYGTLPEPVEKGVSLTVTPKMRVYVRVFDGYAATMSKIERERDALFKSLDKEGLAYDKDTFFLASYNSPMEFRSRHNEIWVQSI